MKHFGLGLASAAAIIAAAPLAADVTAAQVWEKLQEGYQMNPDVTLNFGSVNTADDRIVVRDLVFSSTQDDIIFQGTSPLIDIRERGDGTVEILYAERSPFVFKSTDPAEPFEIGMDAVQTNVRYLVSGEPDRMNFAMSGDQIMLEMTKFQAPDEAIIGSGAIVLTDLTGNSIQTTADGFGYSGDLNVGAITADLKFQNRNDGTGGTVTGQMADLNFQAAVQASSDLATLNSSPSTLESFSLRSSASQSSIAINFNFGEGPFNLELSSDDSDSLLAFDQTMFDLQTKTTGLNFEFFDLNTLPFPVQVAMSELAYGVAGPLGKNQPGDFGMGITLADLSVSDGLWNIFDPAQMFDRSPASLDFQISGVGQWFFDIMDPEDAARMDDSDIPGQVDAINIDRLSLDALGVTADGSGAFTIDNTDFMTFGGAPRPEGSAQLSVTGVNGLMDTLMQMGFIGPEQAMGMRMGMAMFATPGPTEDSLTSDVVINQQGHVIVNGQRLR